ncbi:hypothetical protein SJAG_00788 [Schizosaccharomyces japonicus yFS275]|uniref:Uncharacterized protein n=1 Tax=Schizosaccharomyces japonicus (strain yFS275 / FY16936) TaxID=402676 RepID=B6JWL1_SCHJY|nr:hypothetical protein SJAG_00788 [Schizosaccharomyces japonicus yFS275]EEB05762.1 hypothetical protein SJAG_00788 [Schizosaccharomyces japonicus yFS275]
MTDSDIGKSSASSRSTKTSSISRDEHEFSQGWRNQCASPLRRKDAPKDQMQHQTQENHTSASSSSKRSTLNRTVSTASTNNPITHDSSSAGFVNPFRVFHRRHSFDAKDSAYDDYEDQTVPNPISETWRKWFQK